MRYKYLLTNPCRWREGQAFAVGVSAQVRLPPLHLKSNYMKYKIEYEYKMTGVTEVEAPNAVLAREELYGADLDCETASPLKIKKITKI